MSDEKKKPLTADKLERIRRVGEIFRDIDDAAQRQDAPIVAQAMAVWEQLDEQED